MTMLLAHPLYEPPRRHYPRKHIILRRYRLERDWLRVDGVAETLWFRSLVALLMVAAAAPSGGATILLLPIVLGVLRNRPMTGILVGTLLFGWTGIGWIIALAKACGNH